jgi:EAL domain-containing protein (putative c-di-GMP-specific phosphodiesterase class I)
LNGDEFAIILHGITVETTKVFTETLRRTVEQAEISINGERDPLSVSISIGVAHIDGGLDCQKLLSHADFALHAAKHKGRNRVIFAKREEISLERLSEAGKVLAILKAALKENSFVLFYQPVIRTDNGNVIHYEALIRLKDADGSLISPSRFIPIAETFGLMPQIDKWVIEHIIAKLKANPELTIFANISGVSFSDEDLCNFIKTAITSSGIDPSRIGFEITETATVADLAAASAWIADLRRLGCSFALDDFGIGFSSFSYVIHFPVDYIKIDGSYVRDLDENKQHQAIVGAIVQVAHSLGQQVIAEFVESEQVLQLLREMNVACAQGYHTGRPSPWLPGDSD